MMGLYIFYASLWRAWTDQMNGLVRKPPGLEEGVRLEHFHKGVDEPEMPLLGPLHKACLSG